MIVGICKVLDKMVMLLCLFVYYFCGVGMMMEVVVLFELEINVCFLGFNYVGYILLVIGVV